jgi:hypothetical protein
MTVADTIRFPASGVKADARGRDPRTAAQDRGVREGRGREIVFPFAMGPGPVLGDSLEPSPYPTGPRGSVVARVDHVTRADLVPGPRFAGVEIETSRRAPT